ncbi:MAG: lipoprotein-releasing ABC transporter permease subunit [Thiotrichales bacterium]
MFKPLPLFIGLRYSRAKRRTHFISFISLISIAGIALGVTALITVLSVMNGFQNELRERILGMASHMKVSELDSSLTNWRALQAELNDQPHVLGSAPLIEFEAMLHKDGRVSGAILRGIDPAEEAAVSEVHEKMVGGSMDALRSGEYGIVLGKELALSLGVDMGDKVTVITPQSVVTPAGIVPRMRRFTVVGVFAVGMYEYDRGSAFLQLEDAARLMNLEDKVQALRVKLDDMFRARAMVPLLTERLGPNFWISDWTRQHANFFKAIQMEKRVMFIILLLIVVVAAFNIVSTLVMLVNDKRADIAIMRTLGMSPSGVMGVFVVQGTLIGAVGTLLGVLCGVLLALNIETIVPAIESMFQTKFLSPDIYYISELPSDLKWSDVLLVGTVSFIASIVMTLYPAWQAARTQPAEALRYE